MPQVVYELSLKDNLSSGLHTADHAAKGLEGTLATVEHRLLHVAEGFAVSFGLWKGFEFAKDSLKASEELVQSHAMIVAGLKSTGNAAGVTAEELDASAKKISASVNYTEGNIADLQSMLITFPAITKKNFDDATKSIVDMSARMHQDLKSSAVELGKALQDPVKGIMALRRVGVNFNETQTEMVKHMVATGHAAEAQTFILHELHTEFQGSAEAAFNADPMNQFNKAVEDIEYSLGGVISKVLRDITPALVQFIDGVKDMADWLRKNGHWVKELAKALGIAYLAFKALSLGVASYTALMEGLAPVIAGATTATEGLAAAETTAALPMAAMAALVGSLVVLYDQLSGSIDRAVNAQNEFSPQAKSMESNAMMSQIRNYESHGVDASKAVAIVTGREKSKLEGWIAQSQKEFNQIKENLDKHGFGGQLTEQFKHQLRDKAVELSAYKSELSAVNDMIAAPKTVKGKGAATAAPGTKSETKGAKGNKNETINIHIDNLIKGFSINTTNLKESASKIQEVVTQVMMNAVNNSQIIAGN